MGEESTGLIERARDTESEQLTDASRPDEQTSADASSPGRRGARTRTKLLVGIVVGALVVAGGTIGGIAWAQKLAHDDAVLAAETAHATTGLALVDHDLARDALAAAVAAGLSARDQVATSVIPHLAALGGVDANAPLIAAHTALSDALSEVVGVENPTPETELPQLSARPRPVEVDPTLETEALTALARDFADQGAAAEAASSALRLQTATLEAATTELSEALAAIAGALSSTHAALVAGNPLATADTITAADTALAALTEAPADADLAGLLEAYAGTASGVVASQASETARIAAEEAARNAARNTRGGGSGGGGSSSEGGSGGVYYGSGVRGETNRNRVAHGLGMVSNNETLVHAACAWAQSLAAANGELSHSSSPGGFSLWGENVAYGYGSAAAVVEGWMNSSGHRANILKPQFTAMGACSATSATGRVYWVQQFGA